MTCRKVFRSPFTPWAKKERQQKTSIQDERVYLKGGIWNVLANVLMFVGRGQKKIEESQGKDLGGRKEPKFLRNKLGNMLLIPLYSKSAECVLGPISYYGKK